ncbi:MAG: hypothetical protein ACTSRZ_02965 [Promethearchaeota archaeon]
MNDSTESNSMPTIDPINVKKDKGNNLNEKILKRNEEYIRKRLLKQIDVCLSKGNKYIDEELSNPLLFAIRPIVKTFYNYGARGELEKGSINNMEICIKAALDAINNNDRDLDEIIDKYFEEYFKNDETAKYCNKNHRNFKWLRENTRETFKYQVKPLIDMLKCMDEARNYEELSVKTFKTADNARKALSMQLDSMERGLKKIEEDISILNIPAGRDLILKILKKGFKDTKQELIGDIDIIFGKYSSN